MGPVILNLPSQARLLFNHLRVPMTAADLTEDLVAVRLPGGYVIDVSWHPAHNPVGEYTITLFRDSWDNKELECSTTEIAEIKEVVEALAESYIQTVGRFGPISPFQNVASGSSTVSFRRTLQHA